VETNGRWTLVTRTPSARFQEPPDGRSLQAASGHSDYPRTAGNGQPYTPGYNIAAVIAGLADQNAIHQR
ncbi:hypothetical protein RA989_21105, partial [Mycobacteroides abscessus subsp. massiliense]